MKTTTKKTMLGIAIIALVAVSFAFASPYFTAYEQSPELKSAYTQVKTLMDAQDFDASKKMLLDLREKAKSPREQADIDIRLAMTIALEAVSKHQEAVLIDKARSLLYPLLQKYEDAELYYTAGYVEEVGAAYDHANQFYDLALKLEPNNGKYLFQKGHNYELWGKMAEAKDFYKKALAAEPNDMMVKTANAKLSWRQGDASASIAALEEIAEKTSNIRIKSETYANISDMLVRSNKSADSLKKALDYANKSLAADNSFAFAHVVKAQALLALNQDLDTAYNEATTAIFINPNQAAAYLKLAEIQFVKGELNAASDNLKSFDTVVEKDNTIMPNDRDYWLTNGAAKRLVLLLTVRSLADKAPLFKAKDFESLDMEIVAAMRKLQKEKDGVTKAVTLQAIKTNKEFYALVSGNIDFAQFELSFHPADKKDVPEALKNFPVRGDVDTSPAPLISDAVLQAHEERVEVARKAQEKKVQEEWRSKLERQFLNTPMELAATLAEAKSILNPDEVKIYEQFVAYFAMKENNVFEEQTKENAQKRNQALESLQNLISDTFKHNGNTEIFALMADFQDKFGDKKRAYEYMKSAYESEPQILRYVVRLVQLSTDVKEQAKLRGELAGITRTNTEEEWLYLNALDLNSSASESILLAGEQKIPSDMKPVYYGLMEKFYTAQQNVQKITEYQKLQIDFFFKK